MERMFFERKRANRDRLLAYGFSEKKGNLAYSIEIMEGQFLLEVFVDGQGEVRTRLIDRATEEDYVLHRACGAAGAFVGSVREAYAQALQDIAEHCFEPDVFKGEQARELIAHVRERYGDELEFLWKKFPDNAVWRRGDTSKWYAALLIVPARKLGLDSDERIEIIDLRMEPEAICGLVDHRKYFPGYHMNKKHWITLRLDGSASTEEIIRLIERSRALAAK